MIRGADHFGHREAAGIAVDLFWDRRDLRDEFGVEEGRARRNSLCPVPGNRARGDPGLSSPVLGVGPQAGGVNEDQARRGPPCLRQGCPQDAVLARAADEFALTTVLLFLAVTIVRWLRNPDSALYIADLNMALVVIGALSGAILTGLILTPAGKRSGGHMNPAVTVALWSMGAFPGRRVVPYVLAQLAGSAAGAGFARLVWGNAVSFRQVAVGAIRPAPTWQPEAVFVAETAAMTVLILIVGFLMTRRGSARLVPYAIGLSVGLVIAFLGPRSGGSINPARQLGPAVLSGQTTDLWIYLIAPVLGALAGAGTYRLLIRRTENESKHRSDSAMHVMIAGATGAVGRLIVPQLLDAGHNVTGTSRTPAGVERVKRQGVSAVQVDAFDRDGLFDAVTTAAPDVVIHQLTDLSAADGEATNRLRRAGTRNLVDAAKSAGVRRIITQSISWAYAPGDTPADETAPLDVGAEEPRGGMVEGIRVLEDTAAELDTAVLLRCGILYGPGTWYAPGGAAAAALAGDKDAPFLGYLEADSSVSSFVHVADAAGAAVAALDWPAGPVNIVDDEPAPGREWVPVLAAALGLPAPEARPGRLGWARGASNGLARSRAWRPEYPTWRTGFAMWGNGQAAETVGRRLAGESGR